MYLDVNNLYGGQIMSDDGEMISLDLMKDL